MAQPVAVVPDGETVGRRVDGVHRRNLLSLDSIVLAIAGD